LHQPARRRRSHQRVLPVCGLDSRGRSAWAQPTSLRQAVPLVHLPTR
jgi:hypothetical protein